MTLTSRTSVLLLFLGAACASAGGGRGRAPAVVHQADERLPPLAAFEAGEQRIAYNDALTQEQIGWRAESAGDVAAARAPLEKAARSYLAFVKRYPRSGWDVTFRYHAADLLRRAGLHDEAAALAEQVAADPGADPKSRAMAQLQAANALVGAGKMEALRVEGPEQHGAEPPTPSAPPEPWKRFVDATDAWLQTVEARPAPPTPGAAPPAPGAAPAQPKRENLLMSDGMLALVAARVAYATGDMEQARQRLTAIMERWPDDAQAFQGAAPLYVQTFLAARDYAGAQQAVDHVRGIARTQAQQATTQDARAGYEKVAEEAGRTASGVRFEQARALLEEGRFAEAAKAFEALAEDGGDAATALSGAAVAWDRAGQGQRAAELRRRIVTEHADAKVAPQAALQLAAFLAKKGDHAEAGRVYGEHADRWPDDPNHCTALRNGAVELDLAKRGLDAAARYRAFGDEARCAEESPDVAALALYRAGQLFLAGKRRAEARDAFQATAEVENVSTPDAKRRVAEARTQVKRLGSAAGRRAPAR